MASLPAKEGASLADFLQILRQRLALVALILSLVVVTTLVVTAFLPRWYLATAKIRVEKPEGEVKLFQAQSNASSRKSYDAGYDKARSDTAKQQYQVLNDRQRFGPQGDDRMHVRSVEVPLPERQENGVILAPTTATIRIQE